jgi:hypothetical protein
MLLRRYKQKHYFYSVEYKHAICKYLLQQDQIQIVANCKQHRDEIALHVQSIIQKLRYHNITIPIFCMRKYTIVNYMQKCTR